MKRILSLLVIFITITSFSAVGALAYSSGTLPGGTSIEVDNTDPSDGEVFYIPVGETTIDITDAGTASVGEGVAVADTTLIYVIDASGSTGGSSGGTTCGEQQTHDDESGPNEIIDCEILASINLNDVAVSLGSVDEVAMVLFAGANVTADATPGGGDDPIIDPAADANSNDTPDVNEVLQSIKVAVYGSEESGFELFTDKPTPDLYGTNFGAGIEAALDIAALATNPNVIVVFLSDGLNNKGAHVNTFDYGDVVFHTFAIGSGSSCTSDPWSKGSLKDIADLSGGTCTAVSDPSDLPDILPQLIVATFISLEIEVDGGGAVPIDNADIDPDLPQDDPVTVSYSTTVSGLGPGQHEICITAYGADAGGEGSVTDCKTITVIPLVSIDIKPGSFPNSINPGKKGVIPVAILTTGDFDATTVDGDSARFGPAGAVPVHWAIEDVDGDGDDDMILHFKTQDTGIAEGDTEAMLTATTTGGMDIAGVDSVRTTPPKGKK